MSLSIFTFCWQNEMVKQMMGRMGKSTKTNFHSAHSAILLTLPFHSASRMGRMGKST